MDLELPSLEPPAQQPYKIVLLSARSSIHTVKWANGLVEKGHEVVLLSMHSGGDPLDSRVRFHQLKHKAPLGYFSNVLEVKKILRREQPDLLHAHFVSGYGTLATLTGFLPRVLSVWGTDIYDFPYRSFFNGMLVRKVLSSASWICSTSQVMAIQTSKVYSQASKKMSVTPFGISTEVFKPSDKTVESGPLVIGTIKSLLEKYGIDTLISGFALARKELMNHSPELGQNLLLRIYGQGEQRQQLQELIKKLDLEGCATLESFIPHSQVPQALDKMDIYVAMSREHSESFGVAIIEASACQLPVIVSNYGGLPEVVEDGVTGLVVRENTPEALALKLVDLVLDSSKRQEMGRNGRKRVERLYQWQDCVTLMERVYATVIKRKL